MGLEDGVNKPKPEPQRDDSKKKPDPTKGVRESTQDKVHDIMNPKK